jgi:hypothetical protein
VEAVTVVMVVAVQIISRISGQNAQEILVLPRAQTLAKKHGLAQQRHRVTTIHQVRLAIQVFNSQG